MSLTVRPSSILFINYEFPPLGGGGGRANAEIARRLVQMGHDVTVLTSAYGDLPKEECRDGVSIHRIPTLRRRLERSNVIEMAIFLFSSLVHAVTFVRRHRPDIAIAFFTIPSGPAALLLKHLFGIPYVVSLRGGDVPGFMRKELGFYHALVLPITRLIWRRAKAVVANSEGLRALAQTALSSIPIHVIPNGVDDRFFTPSPRTLSLDPVRAYGRTPLQILTVGRLNPQKGLDILLKAMNLLKSRGLQPFELIIVGDGPLRRELERLTVDYQLNLGEDVRFLGWCDQEWLPKLHATADVFVLSSLYEGMPNALLEAMAGGLPIIATRVAGSEELVREGDNGYLVSPSDACALADALEKIIADPDGRVRMGERSQEIASAYTWETVAESYAKICTQETL